MVIEKDIMEKSFSLIEIIITVFIISFISGFSIIYYNDFNNQKALELETRKLVDVFELAKAKANANDSNLCTGVAAPEVDKYSVNLTVTNYQLMPACLTGTPISVNYQLNSKIVIITPTPASIDFYPSASGATSACVNIMSTALNKCNYINIVSSGIITEGSCSVGSCPCPCPTLP